MRLLFPSDVIEIKQPDDQFVDQIAAFEAAGFDRSLVSLEYLQAGERRIHPKTSPGDCVLYRGWMMTGDDYRQLEAAINAADSSMFTSADLYLSCHHLPNWYPKIEEFTPRTITFPADADLKAELDALNWSAYFIKDYVKSLKTENGSLLTSTENVAQLVEDMIRFRGEIEGGFCVREVEDFVTDSEIRYFVIDGTPHAPDPSLAVPDIVTEAAQRIESRFFTIDAIQRTDGTLRIVEIGDGQVSDIVGWTAERLVEIWNT